MEFVIFIIFLGWGAGCYCFGRHTGFFEGMEASKKIYTAE